jgi:hypothetical protein
MRLASAAIDDSIYTLSVGVRLDPWPEEKQEQWTHDGYTFCVCKKCQRPARRNTLCVRCADEVGIRTVAARTEEAERVRIASDWIRDESGVYGMVSGICVDPWPEEQKQWTHDGRSFNVCEKCRRPAYSSAVCVRCTPDYGVRKTIPKVAELEEAERKRLWGGGKRQFGPDCDLARLGNAFAVRLDPWPDKISAVQSDECTITLTCTECGEETSDGMCSCKRSVCNWDCPACTVDPLVCPELKRRMAESDWIDPRFEYLASPQSDAVSPGTWAADASELEESLRRGLAPRPGVCKHNPAHTHNGYCIACAWEVAGLHDRPIQRWTGELEWQTVQAASGSPMILGSDGR